MTDTMREKFNVIRNGTFNGAVMAFICDKCKTAYSTEYVSNTTNTFIDILCDARDMALKNDDHILAQAITGMIGFVDFETPNYALQKYNEAKALVGELVEAMKSNTAQYAKMHHSKKDRNHEDFGKCPPVERYCSALTKATNWLEGK